MENLNLNNMKIVSFCLVIVGCSACYSQVGNKYELPESVVILISDYLQDKTENHFSVLSCPNDSVFQVTIIEQPSQEGNLRNLIYSSNRYLVNINKKIPIVFEYDFLFSSIVNKVGENKKMIHRSSFIGGGFYVLFTAKGEIIEYGIEK